MLHALFLLLFTVTPLVAEVPEKGNAKTLRLLDTGVFGRKVSEPVVLLLPKLAGSVNPVSIQVDIAEDDRFYAATVSYPKEFGFKQAKASVNSLYAKWEYDSFKNHQRMGLWRNEDERFALQLTIDDKNDCLDLRYICFQTESQIKKRLEGSGLTIPELDVYPKSKTDKNNR